jgi:hypothetical protein
LGFIESAASNTKELNDILTSDLRKYIVAKQGILTIKKSL